MVLCRQVVYLITHFHYLVLHFLPQPAFPSELTTYLSKRIYVFFCLMLISGNFPCFYAHIQVPSNLDPMSHETSVCTLSPPAVLSCFLWEENPAAHSKRKQQCASVRSPIWTERDQDQRTPPKRSGCIILTEPESQFMLLNNCNNRFLSLSLA